MPVPEPQQIQRVTTFVFSAALLVLGLIMMIVSIARGGGALSYGIVIGALFVAAGAGRIWAERQRDR